MKISFRTLIPFLVGMFAAGMLAALYLGIVSWAESPQHAFDLFWEDRQLVIPILAGFGVQAALYSVLKLGLHLPAQPNPVPGGGQASQVSIGAGGTTSTVAMVACCAHHVTDVLPILGLTAAATFLARYQTAFMAAGLAANLIGIGVIATAIRKQKTAYKQRAIVQLVNEDLEI